MRVGIGYDVHRLAPDLKLVLGGVEILAAGADRLSDADVLTHAIMDALLGAAALGDIGQHFPPGDPDLKGISSLVLLDCVMSKLKEKGYVVGNVDAVIVAEQPKLMGYIYDIRKTGCRHENGYRRRQRQGQHLGTAGIRRREEGMVAWAVATIKEENS